MPLASFLFDLANCLIQKPSFCYHGSCTGPFLPPGPLPSVVLLLACTVDQQWRVAGQRAWFGVELTRHSEQASQTSAEASRTCSVSRNSPSSHHSSGLSRFGSFHWFKWSYKVRIRATTFQEPNHSFQLWKKTFLKVCFYALFLCYNLNTTAFWCFKITILLSVGQFLLQNHFVTQMKHTNWIIKSKMEGKKSREIFSIFRYFSKTRE